MTKQTVQIFCVLSLVSAPVLVKAQGIETMGGNSVNMASGIAGAQNSLGSAMSGATAGRLAGESAGHFGRCPPTNQGECMQGALKALQALLSMLQMMQHGGTAAGADLSAFLSDGSAYAPADTSPTPGGTNEIFSPADYKALKDNMAKLQNGIAGSKLDIKKGEVTMADGTRLTLKDISSPEAMRAAGIPQGAIDGLAAYNAKLNKDLNDKAEKLKLGALTGTGGFDEGGGGGGGGGGGFSDTASRPERVAALGGSNREPTNLAGMQKNYNGEPIGVAADSIFHMMSRRYKLKESQDSFFSEGDMALQK